MLNFQIFITSWYYTAYRMGLFGGLTDKRLSGCKTVVGAGRRKTAPFPSLFFKGNGDDPICTRNGAYAHNLFLWTLDL